MAKKSQPIGTPDPEVEEAADHFGAYKTSAQINKAKAEGKMSPAGARQQMELTGSNVPAEPEALTEAEKASEVYTGTGKFKGANALGPVKSKPPAVTEDADAASGVGQKPKFDDDYYAQKRAAYASKERGLSKADAGEFESSRSKASTEDWRDKGWNKSTEDLFAETGAKRVLPRRASPITAPATGPGQDLHKALGTDTDAPEKGPGSFSTPKADQIMDTAKRKGPAAPAPPPQEANSAGEPFKPPAVKQLKATASPKVGPGVDTMGGDVQKYISADLKKYSQEAKPDYGPKPTPQLLRRQIPTDTVTVEKAPIPTMRRDLDLRDAVDSQYPKPRPTDTMATEPAVVKQMRQTSDFVRAQGASPMSQKVRALRDQMTTPPAAKATGSGNESTTQKLQTQLSGQPKTPADVHTDTPLQSTGQRSVASSSTVGSDNINTKAASSNASTATGDWKDTTGWKPPAVNQTQRAASNVADSQSYTPPKVKSLGATGGQNEAAGGYKVKTTFKDFDNAREAARVSHDDLMGQMGKSYAQGKQRLQASQQATGTAPEQPPLTKLRGADAPIQPNMLKSNTLTKMRTNPPIRGTMAPGEIASAGAASGESFGGAASKAMTAADEAVQATRSAGGVLRGVARVAGPIGVAASVGLGAKRVYDTYKSGGDWKTEAGNEALNVGTFGAFEGARNIVGAAKAAKGWFDSSREQAQNQAAQEDKYGSVAQAIQTRHSRTAPTGISSTATASQPQVTNPQPAAPFEPKTGNMHSNLGTNSAPAAQQTDSIPGASIQYGSSTDSTADANRANSIKVLQKDKLLSEWNAPKVKPATAGIMSGAAQLQQKYAPYVGGN